ncbi:MAG: ribonuclease H-like domain-containing protein [Sedimenticolaceae bacterium]
MSLATRLDRLRGHASAAAQCDGLTLRLDQMRRGRPSPPDGRIDPERLAQALGGEIVEDGLVLCRQPYRLAGPGATAGDLAMLPEVHGLGVADWLYIDTETTGLSGGVGNLAFMVGVARFTDRQQIEVRQYVLGNYAAEPAMLRVLGEWIGERAVLVSYNGKGFDLPVLSARSALHRIDAALSQLPHLDLLYTVRRAYRDHWPDCRLQTAERQLLALHRVDDLPGAQAPDAWQAWLRCGETTQLARVMRHNYQDVVSLALLHRRLIEVYAGAPRAGIDHAAIVRAWCDAGQVRQAHNVCERAAGYLDDDGQLLLAQLYRRQGDWARAEQLWLALHARGHAAASLALSKLYEHRLRDYHKALSFAVHCDPSEHRPRLRRLHQKIGSNLQLPL